MPGLLSTMFTILLDFTAYYYNNNYNLVHSRSYHVNYSAYACSILFLASFPVNHLSFVLPLILHNYNNNNTFCGFNPMFFI